MPKTTTELRLLAASMTEQCSTGEQRPANSRALLFGLDDALTTALPTCGLEPCTVSSLFQQPALDELARRSFDKAAELKGPQRTSPIACSPNRAGQLRACEPWVRFWRIVEEAASEADALPLTADDISKAVNFVDGRRD